MNRLHTALALACAFFLAACGAPTEPTDNLDSAALALELTETIPGPLARVATVPHVTNGVTIYPGAFLSEELLSEVNASHSTETDVPYLVQIPGTDVFVNEHLAGDVCMLPLLAPDLSGGVAPSFPGLLVANARVTIPASVHSCPATPCVAGGTCGANHTCSYLVPAQVEISKVLPP